MNSTRDRRTSTTDRLGGMTAFQYDLNGNMTRLTDAQGSQTDYVFDARNLTVAEIFPPGQYEEDDLNGDGYPDARTRTYIYDAAGRLVRRLDQTLAVTTYTYDMASRLLTRAYPDALNDIFGYDAASRLTSAASARYNNCPLRGNELRE